MIKKIITAPFTLSVIMLVVLAVFSVAWWNVRGMEAKRMLLQTQKMAMPDATKLPATPPMPDFAP